MEHSVIEQAMREGDWAKALQIASRFKFIGLDKKVISSAYDALRNPDFYRSVGKDPDAMIEAGKRTLRAKFTGK